MYLEQLKHLIQISKHKSIAAASEIVHLTPQALSLSIKRLEEELEINLLRRTSRGVFLTEKGKELVLISERFFLELSDFKNENEKLITENIRFLITHDERSNILLPILCELYRQYPQVKFKSIKMSKDAILNDIQTGYENLGFLYRHVVENNVINWFNEGDLEFMPLFRREMIVQMHKDFPLATYKTLSIKTLKDIPIIIYHPSDSDNYSMQDVLCLYFTPDNIIYEDNVMLITQMLFSGMGASFTINSPLKNLETTNMLPGYENIVNISLKEKIECEYGVVYRKNYHFTASEKNFLEYIKKYLLRNEIYEINCPF